MMICEKCAAILVLSGSIQPANSIPQIPKWSTSGLPCMQSAICRRCEKESLCFDHPQFSVEHISKLPLESIPVAPTLNPYGTAKDELIGWHQISVNVLRSVYEIIRQTAPKESDYHKTGPGSFWLARQQHEVRLKKVSELLRDFELILEDLKGQP